MGANAQIKVPAFTAGQVLTAAEVTQINTGIPVFATTVTRDAAFGGAGEKVLAQGQYAFIEATNETQYYNGSAWVAVGASGLTLVKAQTIGTTVGSVTVTGAFSTTYDNYLITFNGGVASTNNTASLTLGATATGYYRAGNYQTYAGGGPTIVYDANAVKWSDIGYGTTATLYSTIQIYAPNLVKPTLFTSSVIYPTTGGLNLTQGGYLNNTTQYTDFTLTADTGTWTGGTVRVYGYANS
jgi:hypothetical protein